MSHILHTFSFSIGLTLLAVQQSDATECPYLDDFQKTRYRTCYSGCCGDVHTSFCCIHKHLEAIVLGAVVGFFILTVIISLLVYCCLSYRRHKHEADRQPILTGEHRDYRSVSSGPGSCAQARRPLTDVVIVPTVQIAVTPASPIVYLDSEAKPDQQSDVTDNSHVITDNDRVSVVATDASVNRAHDDRNSRDLTLSEVREIVETEQELNARIKSTTSAHIIN